MIRFKLFTATLLPLLIASFSFGQDNFENELSEDTSILDRAVLAQIIPRMISIPAGFYKLYCRSGDDCPEVNMQAFQIMEHELTWEMYQPCIEYGACRDNSIDGGDEGWGKSDRPIINVSFRDITEHYIPWLNSLTGNLYRLPTEEEWEYAADAGSTSYYHWGDEVGTNQANCAGCGSEWDGIQTAPVMSFPPNSFGIYDMYGNIWELTSNCSTGIDRKSVANCNRRVIRGGSYFEYPAYVGRGALSAKGVDRKQSILGFRLAQNL